MTDIDLVLWDIGQVVYQSPFERFDELEDHTGMARGTLPRGPFVEGGDPEYDLVDSGARDEPEYWRDIESLARESVPGLHIYEALRELGWEGRGRPVVVGILTDIPTRYRQAVLTNDATKFLGEGWRDTWEYAGHFERIVDSLDIGVRKPEAGCGARARPVHRRPHRQRGGRARRRAAGVPLRHHRPGRLRRRPARAARPLRPRVVRTAGRARGPHGRPRP